MTCVGYGKIILLGEHAVDNTHNVGGDPVPWPAGGPQELLSAHPESL